MQIYIYYVFYCLYCFVDICSEASSVQNHQLTTGSVLRTPSTAWHQIGWESTMQLTIWSRPGELRVHGAITDYHMSHEWGWLLKVES